MKKNFDYKAAHELEANYRKLKDINGLLNISLEFWRNLGSIHTFEQRLPKINYYFGRLKDTNGLIRFISDNKREISLINNSELIQVSQKLFEIGLKFPFINDAEFKYLEFLYCSPKYYELIDDILFDKDLLRNPIKSYISDNTKPNEHIDNKNEIKTAILKNLYINDYNSKPFWFYNKVLKKVEFITFDSSAEGVHYPIIDIIDFTVLLEFSKNEVGTDFYNYYWEKLKKMDVKEEYIPYCMFTSSDFEAFQNCINEFFKIKTDWVNRLLEECSKKWLEEFN